MQAKGYTQRDVLQAQVQTSYADALGQMGSGEANGMLGDLARLGVTLGSVGSVMDLTKDALTPMMDLSAAVTAASAWDCTVCGKQGISSKFCPECGAKKPEPRMEWDCLLCGSKGNTTNFCPECGAKKPELSWNCPDCGQLAITTNFCPNCGRRRG